MWFSFIWPFVRRTKARGSVDEGDIWGTRGVESDAIATRFAATWAAAPAERRSLARVCLAVFGPSYLFSYLLYVLRVLLQVAGPMLMREVVLYIEQRDVPVEEQVGAKSEDWWPILLLCLLLCATGTEGLAFQHASRLLMRMATALRAALVTAVYSKSLRLSATGRGDSTAGAVMNLISNDSRRLLDYALFVNLTLGGPILVVIAIVLLFNLVGVSTLAGLAVMLVSFPTTKQLAKYQGKFRSKQMVAMDARLKLSNEVLHGIRAIKLYGWSESFVRKITEIRSEEVGWLYRFLRMDAIARFLFTSVPVLVTVATFGTYVSLGNELKASTVFPAIGLFLIIRIPIQIIPVGITFLAELMVSFARITEFLNLDEKEAAVPRLRDSAPDGCDVVVDNATFDWGADAEDGGGAAAHSGDGKAAAGGDKGGAANGHARAPRANGASDANPATGAAGSAKGKAAGAGSGDSETKSDKGDDNDGKKESSFQLADINLKLKRGSLTAVVGSVGCGKTSLCEAVLAEMRTVAGSVQVYGSVAYAPQSAFVVNDTVRGNVLFGRPYNDALYRAAVKACCLDDDLRQLPGGDMCEIGERGITLSGGQKARISLARCVYARPDVVVLDDPLAAVDAHVGKALFRDCIRGAFGDTTRLWVSNNPDFLPGADTILLVHEGRIVARGTFSELKASSAEFRSVLEQVEQQHRRKSRAASGDDADEAATSEGGGGAARARAQSRSSRTRSRTRSGSAGGAPAGDPAADGGGTGTGNGPEGSALQLSPAEVVRQRRRSSSASSEVDLADGADSEASIPLDAEAEQSKAAEGNAAREGALTSAEGKVEGRVGFKVYARYFREWGSGCSRFALAALFLLSQGCVQLTEYWLARWTERPNDLSVSAYMTVYVGLAVLSGLLGLGRALMFVRQTLRAAKSMHAQMLDSIVHSPMSFFDTTPSGRILNRMSKDTDTVDRILPEMMRTSSTIFLQVLLQFVLILAVNPLMLIMLALVALAYSRIQVLYLPASRDMQRLESIAQSPIYAHLGETLNGTTTIRAFRMEKRFFAEHTKLLDRHSATFLQMHLTNEWMALYQHMSNVIMLTSLAGLVMLSRDVVDPSLSGLALNYSLAASLMLQFAVETLVKTEAMMTSCERVFEFIDLAREGVKKAAASAIADAPAHVNVLAAADAGTGAGAGAAGARGDARTESAAPAPPIAPPPPAGVPPPDVINAAVAGEWPPRGEVVFEDVSVRYRDGLPLVLKGLSCTFPAGKKSALVGRTGAGKSSTITVLLRLVELAGGRVTIDGTDIATMPLDLLRSGRIAVIPQEAMLWSGSLRRNLDPWGKSSDAQMIEALSMSGVLPTLMGWFFDATPDGEDARLRGKGASVNAVASSADDTAGLAGGDAGLGDDGDGGDAAERARTMSMSLQAELAAAQSPVHESAAVAQEGDAVADGGNVLDMEVEENGANFSQGQAQLICLARALLRKPTLLLLDEATASVDPRTDAQVQRTLRTVFKDATIVTIAHRLLTVMDYEHCVVLDQGRVLEAGSPLQLLTAGGAFASLVEATGTDNAAHLRSVAERGAAATATPTTVGSGGGGGDGSHSRAPQ